MRYFFFKSVKIAAS